MALKWWNLTGIVERESQITRQRADTFLDEFAEQERLRREKERKEAAEQFFAPGKQKLEYLKAMQRVSAADQIKQANEALTKLGVDWGNLIPVSESTIKQQIMSGRTWADNLVKYTQEESRQARIDEVRKEAEEWVKWEARKAGANWADYSPAQKESLINDKTSVLLAEYYPKEYGTPEPTLEPEHITIPSIEGKPFGELEVATDDMELRENLLRALTPVKVGNIEWAVEYFSDPEKLRQSLIAEGRNAATETLVKQLYPTMADQQISDYFNPASLVVEAEAGREVERGKWGTFTAGVGDLVANIGGAFRWLGHDGIGEKIAKFGQYMQVQAAPIPFEPDEFTWRQLANPQFLSTYGLRMLPTLMVLAVVAITGFGLAAAAAGPAAAAIAVKFGLGLKLSTVLKTVLSGIGGAALSRPLESALEAGGAYDQARQMGYSHEEADTVADEVFNRNMKLVGLDAAQLAVAFMPMGSLGRSATKAVTRGLVKTTTIAGKMYFVGLTEGGEEVYQEMILKQAMGDERGLKEMLQDPDMQLVFSLGMIAGLGFGAGADIITRITNRGVLGLTPEQKTLFDDSKAEFVAQDMDEEVATIKALDVVIEQNPEVATLIEKATKEVEQEVIQEQAKQVKQKRAAIPEKGKIIPEEVTPVTPEVTKAQYKDYQEIHNAVKAGKLKIGDKTTVSAYGGQAVEIVPPEYKGELDQMGLPLKYRIKEVAIPIAEVTPETTAMAVEETITGEIPEGIVTVEGLEPIRNIQRIDTRFREKQATYAQTKKQLTDYVKELPLAVRGKMLAAVKNVKTELDLTKAIALADKYAEQYAQKTLKTEITNELKKITPRKTAGMRYGRFTAETQRQLNQIKKNTLLDRENVKEQILTNIEAAEKGEISYEQADDANEILAVSGMNGMSSSELAYTLQYIKTLKTTGRGIRAAEREAENIRISTLRENVINIVSGGKGIKPGVGTIDTRAMQPRDTKIKSFLTYWQWGMDDVFDYISRLDKTSKPYQSLVSQLGFGLHMSRSTQDKGVQTYIDDRTANKVKEIYGTKGRGELNNLLGRMIQTKIELGTFANTEGVKLPLSLTKGEIIQKYLELQDPTLDETFREGMKWTDEIISVVKDSMTTEDLKLAEWMAKFNQEHGLTVKPVFEAKYHIPWPENPYYVHIAREKGKEMYAHLLMAQNNYRYAGVTSNSLKARVKNKIPLKFTDAIQTHVRHVIEMEHFKAFSASMKEARMVFGDKDVRTAIRQYHGQEALTHIDRHLDQIARDGIDRALVVSGVDTLRGHFTLAALGVKIAVSFKQALSLPAYLTYQPMPIKDFFTGVADFWSHPIANIREMKEASGYLTERWGRGHERDVRLVKQKDVAGRLSNVKNWRDLLMLGIHTVDTSVTQPGAWAVYRSMKKQGVSKPEAITHAEIATKRSQPSFGLEDMAALRKQGSFGTLFTMFQSQPNKYYRLIANSAMNLKAGRGSKGRNTLNILLAWWVLPMMFQFVSDAFQWKKEHQMRVAILGPANYLLAAGQILQSTYGWISGEPFPAEASPVFSTLRQLQYAIQGTVKLIEQGRDPLKDIDTDYLVSTIEHYAKAIGQLAGLPTPYAVQVERAIRNADIRQMIFSQYALKTEEDAINNLQDIYARDVCGKDKWGDLPKGDPNNPQRGTQAYFYVFRPDLK